MGIRKNCVAVNKRSPLWRPVTLRVAAIGPGEGRRTPQPQRAPLGRKPTFGRASIASGYTPAAFAGAKPRPPCP